MKFFWQRTTNGIVLTEKWFKPFHLLEDDSLIFTYTDRDGKKFQYSPPQRIQTINYCKILFYDNYEGVKDAYVWIIGNKRKIL